MISAAIVSLIAYHVDLAPLNLYNAIYQDFIFSLLPAVLSNNSYTFELTTYNNELGIFLRPTRFSSLRVCLQELANQG